MTIIPIIISLFSLSHDFLKILFILTGITLDVLFRSADLLLRPPYSDWLQRAGLMGLLFTVLYRLVDLMWN